MHRGVPLVRAMLAILLVLASVGLAVPSARAQELPGRYIVVVRLGN